MPFRREQRTNAIIGTVVGAGLVVADLLADQIAGVNARIQGSWLVEGVRCSTSFRSPPIDV